jgi:alkylation response protein AidB-like acyl-CoA dehydrogenase
MVAEARGGIALANSLQVKPKLGSPSRGGMPETLARRTPAGWSISGHKLYSTGCEILSWMLVLARTDEDEPRVGSFLVPARALGVRIEPTWNALGMRATGSHAVIL